MNAIRVGMVLLSCLLGGAMRAQEADLNLSMLAGFDGEPSLAVNPADPSNLIAGWMRLRLDGKVAIAVRSSHDAGETWSPITFLPHMDSGFGSADVSIVFHRSGTAYLSYIDFRTAPDTMGAVYLTSSANGGRSWSAPVKIVGMRDAPDLPIDRPWIAIDNSGGVNDGMICMTSMSAYWYPGRHHVYMRASSDQGATWGPLRRIDSDAYSPGAMTRAYGALDIGADGRISCAYMSYDTAASPLLRIYCAVSVDVGASWQYSVATNVSLALSDAGYTRGYALAADPARSGCALLAWIDARYGDEDVLVKRTSDGGVTWSTARRVNDDAVGNGSVQDLVWAQFNTDGDAAVVWRDRRHGDSSAFSPFDMYAAMTSDGGATFTANRRLSSTSSAFVPLGCCNSFAGVALTRDRIFADWGDYRSGDWEIRLYRAPSLLAVEPSAAPSTVGTELAAPYPNPCSGSTVVRFLIAGEQALHARLTLHDLFGRELLLVAEGSFQPGPHDARCDFGGASRDLPSGLYMLRLSTAGSTSIRKIAFVP